MTAFKKILYTLGALAALYLFVILFLYFSYWGIGAGIVLLILATLIVLLALLINYIFSHARTIHAGLLWLSRTLAKARVVQRVETFFGKRTPRLYHTVGGTFDITTMQGMFLLLGVIVCAIFIALFFGVAGDTFFYSKLLAADPRIIYLFRTFVSGQATAFFVFVENLATIKMLIILLLGVSLFLLIVRRHRWILAFTTLMATGFLMTFGLKILFQRPRPFDLNFIALPRDPSFPSGHAIMAVCAYGFIAYMLLRSVRSRVARTTFIILFFVLIFLIGASRIYLGVHYPSDVFAGWYLGLALLSLFITFAEIDFRIRKKMSKEKVHESSQIIQMGSAFLLLIVFAIAAIRTSQAIEIVRPLEQVYSVRSVTDFLDTADKYSENLIGDRMAPISFIVISTPSQLETIFQRAQWYMAVAPTFPNVLRLTSAISKNGAYQTAPMTPAFYAGKTNILGFEKPTDRASARQRHHTRFWDSGGRLNDATIWVATASFDENVGLGTAINFPTHRINPDIDTEREYIFNELTATGSIAHYEKVDLVGPVQGVNATGEPFFTDGMAYIIYLK